MKDELDVTRVGALGLLTDMPYSEVPPQGWTDGRNVRFHEDRVIAFPGHVLATLVPGLSQCWSVSTVTSPTGHFWLLAGEDAAVPNTAKIFAYDGTTLTDITGAVISGGVNCRCYVDTLINQNVVFTNRTNIPRFWPTNLGQTFTDLPGWDTNWRCKLIAAFKGFLFAGDMEETGVRYPYRLRWSDEAPPGGIPQNWDAADLSSLAGLQDLGDVTAELRALSALRDVLIVCTEEETIGVQLVGGNNLWRFYTISRTSGAIAPRATAPFRGRLVIVGDDDVLLTDGQSVQSIIDRKRRKALFAELNFDQVSQVWAQVQPAFNEIWIGFPGQGSSYCNIAYTWNWEHGTWGVRDLPLDNFDASRGLNIAGASVPLWNNIPGTWVEQTRRWNTTNASSSEDVFLLPGGPVPPDVGVRVFTTEQTNQYDNVNRLSRVEKLGIRLHQDHNVVSHEIWPRVEGGPLRVQVGSQDSPAGPVSWKVSKTFTPGVDRKLTYRLNGRYLAVAFESDNVGGMQLNGFLLKYKRRGAR